MRHLTRSLEIELECMDMSKDVVFLEELDNQRLIKVALGLYCVIFALIALDIISDYGDGIEWSHLIAEVVVLLIAVIGIGLFWRQYYQSTQLTLRALQTNLTAAHEEVQRWRNESHEFIAGLGVEIQKQFKRWELSNAEAEVGLLLLKGFSHQEIANIRNSSERTVREQARAVYRKSNKPGALLCLHFF
jgi:hypothetical protein